jgi:hypothetical protein
VSTAPIVLEPSCPGPTIESPTCKAEIGTACAQRNPNSPAITAQSCSN